MYLSDAWVSLLCLTFLPPPSLPLSLPFSLPPFLQLKNMDYFSQYVTDEDFEHYVNRKRFDNCYGNNVEMQAIAEIYNRSIEVFQYTTGIADITYTTLVL